MLKANLPGFEAHQLDEGHKFWVGQLPDRLLPDPKEFAVLWAMHPAAFHEIKMHGRLVKTPRWQQAYGTDYHYTGRVNRALPIPAVLEPFLCWSREHVDQSLNGFLLNWYDGALGHYIGRHRDSTKNLIPGRPIVTISFGEARIFRIRPYGRSDRSRKFDFPTTNGSVFVMPHETNLAFTHEVPRCSPQSGLRISITLRAFLNSQAHPDSAF